MKLQQLLTIAAGGCLLAVFVPTSAQAQAPLPGIIEDLCDEIALEADEANDELNEAERDLRDCPLEFDDCLNGLFNDDPVSCTVDYLDCAGDANRDVAQACERFGRRLNDAYEDALRAARREGPGVERRLQRFIDGDSQARQECGRPAIQVAVRCARGL